MDRERKIGDGDSFGRAADVYERSRPTYPLEAARWLVPEGALTVLDLGAGTGKFTRSLVELGLDVIAVEPDERMRATLASALPVVTALAGTAEHLPVADASVDAITVAQAWHWVDPTLAVPEAARALRPGGTLGLVWNLRDERVDWVRELGIAMHRSEAERFTEGAIEIGEPFGETEYFEVEWSRETDLDGVLELVASRSYFITADDAGKREITDGVRALLAEHPDLRGKTTFELPYVTRCFRARLR